MKSTDLCNKKPPSRVIASEISPVQAPPCFPGSQEKKHYQEASTSSLHGGEIRIYPWNQNIPLKSGQAQAAHWVFFLPDRCVPDLEANTSQNYKIQNIYTLYFWKSDLTFYQNAQLRSLIVNRSQKSSQNSSKYHNCFSAKGKALRKVRWDAGVREQSPFAS